MRIKLIKSEYDKETGISTATISTDYGIFTGTSKLHEEDKHLESNFAGCHYAEMRAIIKYMKHRLKLLNEHIKALEDYKKVVEGKKDYEHNSSENRSLRKRIYILKKQKEQWISKINSLNNKILDSMNQREKFIKSLEKGEKK